MPKILETPNFKTEKEEAEWWDSPEGQAAIEQGFAEAEREGTLRRRPATKRAPIPTTTIRLDPQDIELAKAQAETRGLRYQTYLKSLIHQALRQEAGL